MRLATSSVIHRRDFALLLREGRWIWRCGLVQRFITERQAERLLALLWELPGVYGEPDIRLLAKPV